MPNGRIKFESGLGKKATSPAFGICVMEITDSPNIILERIKL